MSFEWKGVMPAITTCFDDSLEIDHEFTARHVNWLVDNGSTGIVTNGSLGEGATLSVDEKVALWKTCVEAVGDRVPVIASIASLSTREGVDLAKRAEEAGCKGLMVLPPYVHKGDNREMLAHVSTIVAATGLSSMLYNNPIAYGVDFSAEEIFELADKHENLHAVKESSGDVRRISAIRELDKDRLAVFVGLDDAIVEGIAAGAVGWVAGLVNALPKESVRLFETALNRENCDNLYHWFLPLLRLDVVPKFVQLIKLVQQEVGMGNTNVRPPRLELTAVEREDAMRIISKALGQKANA
ncbi:MAG: dihydrodipicolinate synthase family protein [Pyrinomonadaceae bacterium]|nr:dihydrodipicolinate synthase family protein [Pyrinomonadaceae bacterium]